MFKAYKILFSMALAVASSAFGQDYNFSYPGINRDIPDENPFGITDVQRISVGSDAIITDLNVFLAIRETGFGGFNGDLFATLRHDSGFSVLLNRPGAREGTPSGYSDSGIRVTFDDSALSDIHSYRLVLSGDEDRPVSVALEGTWQPDGRNVDPDLVLPSSPRTAMLDSFQGVPLDGSWTLFVSDLSAGGTHVLESWSMRVQTIPEPIPLAIGVLFVVAFALRRAARRF